MSTMGRRQFLHALTTAGTATLLGAHPASVVAEPPPETKTLRLGWTGSTCQAPQYVADELLKLEGFTEVTFADFSEGGGIGVARGLAAGRADLTMNFIGPPPCPA
jgi:NitT/TauT family transport system substrate-binding protein